MNKNNSFSELEKFDNTSILVTGGTGSFGKRFVKSVLENYDIKKIVVFSRDEQKHHDMSMEKEFCNDPRIRYFIGDVRDPDRLSLAMHDIDFVVHAAAMKHVPTAEYNPFECVQTNIHGAQNVVRACLDANVKKVMALSTDKACNPINLYGATKLASDKIFVAANNLAGGRRTRFSVVRYGNVIGSRGSVIPFFANLIKDGSDSLPITDERMTRFWITLQQGVDFVMSNFGLMHGGEIFIPKIPSMRVTELARIMSPKAKLEFVGIRPGEKLHEMMITTDDAINTLELDDRYIIQPTMSWWNRTAYSEVAVGDVPETFSYSSDNNSDWISDEKMHEHIKQWM